MSDKKKTKKKDDTTNQGSNQGSNHEASHETMNDEVSFIPGSSVIDIGALRRAQANVDAFLEDEVLEEGSEPIDAHGLDAETKQLLEDFDHDPELKKDVLSEFQEDESNENLERIASTITEQEVEQLKHYEKLAGEVSDELKVMNDVQIAEDKLLEGAMAREAITAHEAESTEGLELEELSERDQELISALPHADENGAYDLADLQSCIEALLFYSDRPVSLKKLKDMLEMTEAEDAPVLQAIEALKAEFAQKLHGFEVAEIAGGYQLRTKASKAPLLRKLAKVQVQRLSRGAMETLTIVAYKQPCTKDDIDSVRGVDSSHFIRTLLDRKLVEVTGRSEAAGRPMIYATTDHFLEVFGLMDLKALPPLREIEAMVPQMAAATEGEEDPRVIQMRKMVHQMKTESNHLDYDAKEDEKILQEIRNRVKSIDISTPYLERQKQLAEQGITGEEAETILMQEFNLSKATSGGEEIQAREEQHSMDFNPEESAPPAPESADEETDSSQH